MHWSTRVERCAAELPGIAEESVSLEDKTASVRLDRPATDDAFKAAVEKAGR
nr:heavy-metal-associated domain-containing protein [Clostridium phoceensis]